MYCVETIIIRHFCVTRLSFYSAQSVTQDAQDDCYMYKAKRLLYIDTKLNKLIQSTEHTQWSSHVYKPRGWTIIIEIKYKCVLIRHTHMCNIINNKDYNNEEHKLYDWLMKLNIISIYKHIYI